MCINYDLCVGIRAMVEADLQAVSQIEQECFSDSWPLEGFAQCLIYNENFVLYLIDGADGHARPYDIIGYLIGMGIIDEFHIYNLAIQNKYQRKGYGSYLFTTVQKMHGSKYCKYLLEVRVSNFKAINFYKKFNFQNVYIRKNYYNNPIEDAQIMELEINAQAG